VFRLLNKAIFRLIVMRLTDTCVFCVYVDSDGMCQSNSTFSDVCAFGRIAPRASALDGTGMTGFIAHIALRFCWSEASLEFCVTRGSCFGSWYLGTDVYENTTFSIFRIPGTLTQKTVVRIVSVQKPSWNVTFKNWIYPRMSVECFCELCHEHSVL
jgi:hypothetical protein